MKLPLLIAISTLIISGSAALGIPLPPSHLFPSNLINDTNISLQAPGQSPNLTFTPWPRGSYRIKLPSHTGDFDLVIASTKSFSASRLVNVHTLQDFVRDFAANIEREYPIPAYVPRHVSQDYFDLDSYTRWDIRLNNVPFIGYKLLTERALLALNELARQLGIHGPAEVVFSVASGSGGYRVDSWGLLDFVPLSGRSVNASLTREGSIFQTS